MFFISKETFSQCAVNMPSISTSGSCAVASFYPTGSSSSIETMWAKNTNGTITAETAWSTTTSTTYCPSVSGYYRMCARVNSSCTVYESSDTYVTVGSTCSSCANNLISNYSFESNTTGWTTSNGAFSRTTNYAPCGSYKANYAPNNNSNWLWTDIGNGSDIYSGTANLSFFGAISSSSYSADVRIYAYDMNWNSLGYSNYVQIDKVLNNSPAGLQQYNLSYVLPSGTRFIQVGFWADNGSILYVDNFCLTANTTVQTCNNVTSGGTIGSDETFCGSSFDPANITNITSPSGGSGTLEYIWLQSYDGGTTSTSISGAYGATYNPPVISQTTWYRRCARRAGCSNYDGESNWIKKEVSFCAPSLSCSGSNKFQWNQTINPTTGSNGYSAVRFICGSTTTYTISSLPVAFAGPVTVNVSDAVSYDGYVGRTSTGVSGQDHEQWRVLFKKNGATVYATPYTGDVADNVEQAYWQGSLGTSTFLPNGADQIVLEHYCVANSTSGPHSVVPMGICVDYSSSTCLNQTDLVTNGTFNTASVTGFNTQVPSGSYGFTTNPSTVYGSWPSFGDITTGTGNMMWFSDDQTPISNRKSWYQTYSVVAGDNYTFAVYARNLLSGSGQTPTIKLTANGSQIGTATTLNYNNGWTLIAATYTPTTSGNVEFAIVLSNNGVYYDYVLDNVQLIKCSNCSNITSGGTIGANQDYCGATDPAMINNVTLPTGGSGTIVYQWQKSEDGGVTWLTNTSATSSSYDPVGVITVNTIYRRQARRSTCSDWVNSNYVYVNVNSCTFTAPSLSCSGSNKFQWNQTISSTTGSNGYSTVRFICGSTQTYTISTLPTAFSSAVTVNVSDAVSYDGYLGRTSTGLQANEKWRVLFKKNGATVYATPYTGDIADGVEQASWQGSLGTSTLLPNGADQIVLEHFCEANGTSTGPNSVVPIGICVDYTPCGNITSPGSIATNYSYCVSGNPPAFTSVNPASGGCDGSIEYQWQISSNNSTWTNISGATSATYDAGNLTSTTYYRRAAKRTTQTTWLYSNVLTITINPAPTANAGPDKTLTCTTPSATLGVASTAGYTYSWSPATGLSSTTVSNPTTTATANTTYTVTVTNSTTGCTASDVVIVTVNKTPPIANAGIDYTINCTNLSATLGVASVSGYSYSWLPATGLNATNIAQPIATPTSTTTYTVTVTGTNGCTATDAIVITYDKTPPTANAGADKTLTCTTPSATLGVASTAGYTYSWSPATGLSSTTVSNPTTTATANTTYTVTVTGANGCTASDVVIVTVNKTAPTANAGPDKTLTCTTASATLGVASTAGYTYSWSPATGLSSTTVSNPTTTATANTTYTVTVTGSNGCTASDIVVVTVNKTNPTSGITGLNTVCATESLTLQANPTNSNFTYAWSATGGATTTGLTTNSNITYTWPSAVANTTQTVTLVVTNTTNGCTSTYTHSVNVTTEVFANAGPDKTICQGASTQIGASPSGPAGATYSWAPNYAINSTSVANPVVTPLTTTTYTLTTTLNGCVKTDMVTVNVNVLLGPGAEAGNAVSTCAGQAITIGGNPTSTSAGVSYLWTPSTGLNNSTIANPQVTTSTSGWYKVKVTNNSGCYNEDSVYVTINPCININGNVYVDNNGPTNVDGTGTGSAGTTQLYANLTNTSGTVIASVPVNANGTYQFNFLTPNTTYNMVLSTTQGTVGNPAPSTTLPTGWSNVSEDCCDNTGNDGTTNGTTSVTVGTSNVSNVNFGITQPLSLGNTVWNDVNKDGIKQTTESGIQGATVYLYKDANNDNVPDGAAIANTTTNANGNYVFNGLTPGNYIVGVVPPTPTSGAPYTSSPVNEMDPDLNVDNNDNGVTTTSGQTYSNAITLAAGTEPTGETPNNGTAPDANSNLTLDFGFYQAISITGNLFEDNNGPTNVDGTGIGTPSATPVYANLVNTSGNVVAVVPVASNGTFTFTDVQPNSSYTVVMSTTQGTIGNPSPAPSLPAGWYNVSEDCCDNTGNDGTTNGITNVNIGTTNVDNVNFGITQQMSIGNLVWEDTDRDGLKGSTEPGISGATVNLYMDANNDGTPDGVAIHTTTTNTLGYYVFNGLAMGNYIVGVVPPTPTTGNPYISSKIDELNPNSDTDNNDNGISTTGSETYSGTVVLVPNMEPLGELPNNATASDANANLTIDFGFYQPVNILGNVFVDNNGPANVDGNGIGIASGNQLYANLTDPTGNVIAVVPVTVSGTFAFNDVTPNTSYSVILSTTQGIVGNPAPTSALPTDWRNVSEDCCDNIGNDGATNGILSVAVTNIDQINANFGIYQPLSLGNLVWLDDNKNGIKDPTESGIDNVTVNLYHDANLDGTPDGAAIQTTTTDPNGLYVFNDLFRGNYIVGVVPPAETGGSNTISTVGEEMNPNLNGDNNDNGIVTIGNETFSGTIGLVANTEPLGELPNNATSVDASANLTLDFAFILCPDNFTFDPVYVCAGTTVDLTTLVSADYSGGTWYQGGQPITNTNVSTGTFEYVYTNGTCTATGTVTLETQVPDYAPTIAITPAVVNGNKPVRVIITISELLNRGSCTPIYVFVPRLEPRFVFSWEPTATAFGSISVTNTDWQYYTSNPNFYIWQYIGQSTFPPLGSSKFGYVGTYDPHNTDGITTFSVQIFQGSGGETNLNNNTDSENLLYFRE
ncbi:MAG: SdrD B-like domain-containing protein [Chitinophagaceae bacterium]